MISKLTRKTVDQSVSFLIYIKFMKVVSASKERNIFSHCYLNINVVFGKVIQAYSQ